MDVGLYVSELLNELNEVSLPGIGTFFKKKTSAYYDERQGIFFPPSEEVAFRTGNIPASPQLINHICRERNISEPSARYFTEKYSDSLKQALQIKGYAVIGNLGKLRLTSDVYSFEPAFSEDNTATYGLSPVMEIRKKVSFKDSAPDFSAIKIKEPVQAEKVIAEMDRRSYKTPIIIGLLLLLVSAFIVTSYLYFPQVYNLIKRKDPVKVTAPKVKPVPPRPATLKDSMAKADSIMEKSFEQLKDDDITIEKSRDTIEISTKAKPIKQDTVKPSVAAATIKYEIICAAFNKKSEAEDYIRYTRKKGIDAHIVEDTKKPKFKISMGSFTDNESAQKERRRIQEKIAKDAWILTIKNK